MPRRLLPLSGGGGGWRPISRSGRFGARVGRGCTEGAAPLVAVLAAGHFLASAVIQDQELVRRFIHSNGHHGQALGIFFLALTCHTVIVFLRPFGMQFAPASNALRHIFLSAIDGTPVTRGPNAGARGS